MANLTGLLGTMLATGLGGRSARGPVFAQGTTPAAPAALHGGGGNFRQVAGLASLGYLAYKAYQTHKAQDPAAQQTAGVHLQGRSARGDGPSLGDRLGDLLSRGPAPAGPDPQIADEKALLLIRAMVAAANADGEIDAEERRRILDSLDRAGAGAEERALLDRELADPPSLEDVVAGVRDQETAEQVYVASELAVEPDGRAERNYLAYLADRLRLPESRVEELKRIA
ncbi:tellurite resistance TerB family protein [Rhodospirillum centenum]|uniref:Tellurite resistance TerB family protein n=1 Tax=Rhodospirillum centenum (strain ATCC 51521 / SW) TaxID=414684 RepID=B6IWL6_RHOCS|nr:tellurite resistance TerB family protein [Rhodospirillum centenum]ACJ00690.1 conserved hypothetical protein [Rhodospirillum centenum SW]